MTKKLTIVKGKGTKAQRPTKTYQLLTKVRDTQERLNYVVDGQNEIGNLAIVVSQLADVVFALINELSPVTADSDPALADYEYAKRQWSEGWREE